MSWSVIHGGLYPNGDLLGDGFAVRADEAVAVDDCGGGVELAIVGGNKVHATVDAIEEQETGAALGVEGGGQPDVGGDVAGGEVEAEALMDIEDEASADFEVVKEVALAADEDAVLFVDPGVPDEVAEHLLKFAVGLGVRVAGVVEDDGGPAVEVNAARVGEGASSRMRETVRMSSPFESVALPSLARFSRRSLALATSLSILSLSFWVSLSESGLPSRATMRSTRIPSMVRLSESVVSVFLILPLRSNSCCSRWTW